MSAEGRSCRESEVGGGFLTPQEKRELAMRNQMKWRLALLLLFVAGAVAACNPTETDQTPCTGPEDCTEEGAICGADGFCTTGNQTCVRHNECGGGQFCKEGSCASDSCEDDAYCGKGNICEGNHCITGCRDNSGCEGGTTCNAGTLKCEQKACGDVSCAANQTCDQSGGQSVCKFTGDCSCEETDTLKKKNGESDEDFCKRVSKVDTTCSLWASQESKAGNYYCSPTKKKCVAENACASRRDCKDHEICVEVASTDGKTAQLCQEGCETNGDCSYLGKSTVCLKIEGTVYNWKTCQKGCVRDSECLGTEFCSESKCQERCETSASCEEGYVCRADEIVSTGSSKKLRCQKCRLDNDCEGGLECQKEGGASLGLCKKKVLCPVDQYEKDFSIPESIVGNWNKDNAYAIESLPFETSEESTSDFRDPNFCVSSLEGVRKGEWFKINPGESKMVTVRVEPRRAGADLNLEVKDSAENTVVLDNRDVAEGEVKFYVADPDQTFYVVVTGILEDNYVPYFLSITEEDHSCTSPSNKDKGHAQEITEVEYQDIVDKRETSVGPQTLCTGSELWYKFKPGDNRVVDIVLSAENRLGEVVYSVEDKNQVNPENTSREEKGIKFTTSGDVSKKNDYYYYIIKPKDKYTSSVDVQFTIKTEKSICVDDYQISSDSKGCSNEQIAKLTSLTSDNLESRKTDTTRYPFFGTQRPSSEAALEANVCKTPDYYCIGVPPKAGFDFYFCPKKGAKGSEQIAFKGPSVCNSTVVPTGSTQYNTAAEIVSNPDIAAGMSGTEAEKEKDWEDYDGCTRYEFEDLVQGVYCAEVSLRAGARLEYRFKFVSKAAGACPEDSKSSKPADQAVAFDKTKARQGNDNVVNDAFLCDKAEAWYKVELKNGDTAKFDVKYRSEGGDLDTYIYKSSNGSSCDGATDLLKDSVGNDTPDADGAATSSVEFTANEDATYCLKIAPQGYARTYFSVQLTLNDKTAASPNCPDELESNDSVADAKLIVPGTYSDLTVCKTSTQLENQGYKYSNPAKVNKDFYKLAVKAGEKLTVTVSPDTDAVGNVKYGLGLFDATPTTTELKTNKKCGQATCTEVVEATHDTTLYIGLEGSIPGRYKYDLKVEVAAAPACPSDDNNHAKTDATDLGEKNTVFNKGILCAKGEVDWYKVTVPTDKKLTVITRFDKKNTLNTVIESNGSVVATTPKDFNSGNGGKKYEVDATNSEKVYYIKVSGENNVRARYALAVAVGDTVYDQNDLRCPDVYEYNNTLADAKKLESTSVADLTLCNGTSSTSRSPVFGRKAAEPDYYTIDVDAHATLEVNISFENGSFGTSTVADGQVKATIEDENGSELVKKEVSNGNITISYKNDADRPVKYVLHILPEGNEVWDVFYTLDYNVTYDNTIACNSPDAAATNIAAKQALATTAISSFDGEVSICSNAEEHWYYLGDNITSFTGYIGYLADPVEVQMDIVNDAGVAVESVKDSGAKLEKTDLTKGEKYYLRIRELTRPLSLRVNYKLWYETNAESPVLAYCGDEFELNDVSSAAYTIALTDDVFMSKKPIMCKAEEDWYKVNLQAGDYTVGVLGDGGLTLDVYKDGALTTAAAQVTAGATGSDRFANAGFTAEAADYYIKVAGGAAGKAFPYTLLVYKNSAFDDETGCMGQDGFEKFTIPPLTVTDNNTVGNAKPIKYSEYSTTFSPGYATICNGDAGDWYSIKGTGTKEFKVTVYAPEGKSVTLAEKNDIFDSFFGKDKVTGTGTVTYTYNSKSGSVTFGVKGNGTQKFPYFITVEEVP